MSIQSALYEHLKDDSAISTIVGSKVYPLVASDDDSPPYITFQLITRGHEHDLGAASGLARTRMQVNCWQSTPTLAETLADTVRDALDGFSGTMGTTNTAAVKSCRLDGDFEDYDPPPDPDRAEAGVFSVKMDFLIWYTETIPTF